LSELYTESEHNVHVKIVTIWKTAEALSSPTSSQTLSLAFGL